MEIMEDCVFSNCVKEKDKSSILKVRKSPRNVQITNSNYNKDKSIKCIIGRNFGIVFQYAGKVQDVFVNLVLEHSFKFTKQKMKQCKEFPRAFPTVQ